MRANPFYMAKSKNEWTKYNYYGATLTRGVRVEVDRIIAAIPTATLDAPFDPELVGARVGPERGGTEIRPLWEAHVEGAHLSLTPRWGWYGVRPSPIPPLRTAEVLNFELSQPVACLAAGLPLDGVEAISVDIHAAPCSTVWGFREEARAYAAAVGKWATKREAELSG